MEYKANNLEVNDEKIVKKVKELALIMKETGLTSLNIDKFSINMERPPEGGVLVSAPAVTVAAPSATADVPQTQESAAQGIAVKSPMVGVFYSAPGTDSEPYVSVGDKVTAGDVLCIIEAMKIMNEITAEHDGVITEVCAENKQIVEFGQVLFRIDTN